jgi:hypothetical protein
MVATVVAPASAAEATHNLARGRLSLHGNGFGF